MIVPVAIAGILIMAILPNQAFAYSSYKSYKGHHGYYKSSNTQDTEIFGLPTL